jgi:7-alpha-hydroxysteroid dehydrogenase
MDLDHAGAMELLPAIGAPLQRYGTPEDIGAAVVFLASPAASWISGQCLNVSGGL